MPYSEKLSTPIKGSAATARDFYLSPMEVVRHPLGYKGLSLPMYFRVEISMQMMPRKVSNMSVVKCLKSLRSHARGFLSYFTNERLRNVWGGAFNGQEIRQGIFLELATALKLQNAVETGTYRGDTTAFISEAVGGVVYSVENNATDVGFSRARFIFNRRVKIKHGDSRTWLKRLLNEPRFKSGVSFFYLDAHWHEDLPLFDELDIIFSSEVNAIAMIDDFQVPGDPGYAFDDYGPEKEVTLKYIERILQRYELECFFPAAASANETGARRGCAVIAPQDLAKKIDQLNSLQRHHS